VRTPTRASAGPDVYSDASPGGDAAPATFEQHLLRLQSTAGNTAVARMLQRQVPAEDI